LKNKRLMFFIYTKIYKIENEHNSLKAGVV